MIRDEPSTEMLPGSSAASPRVPAVTDSLIGRSFGRFAIVEQLGRGGSGDVYRAEQAQLGRSAVIKVLRRDATGGHAAHRIERFLREAKLASKLDHPYAAHVYAFGAESDGSLWIAMEHVRGRTLDELIATRGALPPPIFGPLFGRLCEVVHTAHELGIIHRDIKGSNVMVIERAGQLLPKLLDFGIAKLGETRDVTGEEAPHAIELTQEGSTLGSPHYMAPEQWQDASAVDARSDIYALGALAYRCLAGHLPFRDTERRALASAHQLRPPPPLPDRLSTALTEVVLRALAKRPDGRWATALAFGEAVRVAVGTAAPEIVPIFDPYTRDVWLRAGPQPLGVALARLVGATTTVDADAALRELVAITCRWLAVLALAALLDAGSSREALDAGVRERLRA
ncbi:MAG: serine/threonine-protein kinase, partial [Proteobacteria bacterium]|nr:serine/threonine-protein kinase [Pseudomonadota bacterium]